MAEVDALAAELARAVLDRGGEFEGFGVRVKLPPPKLETEDKPKPAGREQRVRGMLNDPQEG